MYCDVWPSDPSSDVLLDDLRDLRGETGMGRFVERLGVEVSSVYQWETLRLSLSET